MDVSKHLEKAAESLRKKNFDYAISLYHQVLQLKPDHGEARRELRTALVRRAEYKKVPPVIALLQGVPFRVGMLFGSLLRKPQQVVLAAENYLKNDPANRGVNRALAHALEKANCRRSAVAVWEFLADDEVVGDEALKRAGALYYELKEMPKALGCYEAVLKRSPRDSEAEKMRKNLAAEGVLSSGSYDPTKSSRDLARNKAEKQELEIGHKIVTTEDERDILTRKLTAEIERDPSNLRARRALVDHLAKARSYAAAIEVLEAGIEIDADSYELRERLGDIRLLDYDQQIREAKAKAAAGDAAAQTDVIDLTRERHEFELEEVSRRVQAHPTDLDLRFRLGRLKLVEGELDAAVESFQHSVKDPRRRVESLLGLGEAFERKGLLDLSRKQFESALESVDAGSDRATEIVYALGVLDEKAGAVDAARTRFESIYERNIHYRDVGDRLKALAEARPQPSAAATEASRTKPPKTEPSQTEPPKLKKNDEAAGESSASSSTYDFKD